MRHRAMLMMLLALPGCADSNKAVPRTPAGAVPSAVALSLGDFVDTDQNRYRDTTTITAYVYSTAYPIPLPAKGSFDFELQTTSGTTLTHWLFDEKRAAQALREMAPGPGFVFNLSLVGADKLEQSEAEIVCTFRPLSGPPIRARPSAPVAIGSVNRSRGSN